MKQFFLTLAIILSAMVSFGQEEKVAKDLKVSNAGDNLLLSWTGAQHTKEGSWQVEASVDGRTFAVIGLVWGSDPKSAEASYSFRQKTEKIRAGYKYYRVQFANANQELQISKTVGLSK